MREMQQYVGLIFLGFNGLYDVKYKKISRKSLLFFGLLLMILWGIKAHEEFMGALASFIPGMIFVLIAWICPKVLGMGDGLCVLLLGFCWRMQEVMEICLLALGLAGVVGLVLVCMKKATKETKLPFIPFLFVGAVLECLKVWEIC